MTTRSSHLVAIVLLGFATTGCDDKIFHDFDRDYDFTKVETYAWADVDTSRGSPLVHQRIQNAIESNLAAVGVRQVQENPTVYIDYHGSSEENVVLDSTHHGFGPGWRWGGAYGGGVTTTRARTYEVGTLVIDMWDASEQQLVWRGTAKGTVPENPQKVSKQIYKTIERIFKRFPPEVKD